MFKFKNEYETENLEKNRTEQTRPEKSEHITEKSDQNFETGENQKQHGPAQFRS
jgi:hypothetical protein